VKAEMYEEALENYQKELDLEVKSNNSDKIPEALLYEIIADMCLKTNQKPKAIEFLEKSLRIKRIYHNEMHPIVADLKKYIQELKSEEV